MNRSRCLKALACLLALPDGASARANNVALTSQIAKEVQTFLTAFNDLDWPRFIDHFMADASFFAPVNQSRRLDGRDEIAQFFREVFAQTKSESGRSRPPYMHLAARDLRVQGSNDSAVASFHLLEPDGSIHRRTLLFMRSAGRWRIAHLHASNFLAPVKSA